MTRFQGNDGKWVYLIHGEEVSEDEYFRRLGASGESSSLVGWKPLHSNAMAVHPDQVGEARADSVARGVPTDFDAQGRPILRTRQHRREYMRRYGYFDRAGGYGDAQRGSHQTGDRSPAPKPELFDGE